MEKRNNKDNKNLKSSSKVLESGEDKVKLYDTLENNKDNPLNKTIVQEGKKIYCPKCCKEVKPNELLIGVGGCVYCPENESFTNFTKIEKVSTIREKIHSDIINNVTKTEEECIKESSLLMDEEGLDIFYASNNLTFFFPMDIDKAVMKIYKYRSDNK